MNELLKLPNFVEASANRAEGKDGKIGTGYGARRHSSVVGPEPLTRNPSRQETSIREEALLWKVCLALQGPDIPSSVVLVSRFYELSYTSLSIFASDFCTGRGQAPFQF